MYTTAYGMLQDDYVPLLIIIWIVSGSRAPSASTLSLHGYTKHHFALRALYLSARLSKQTDGSHSRLFPRNFWNSLGHIIVSGNMAAAARAYYLTGNEIANEMSVSIIDLCFYHHHKESLTLTLCESRKTTFFIFEWFFSSPVLRPLYAFVLAVFIKSSNVLRQ